MRRFYFFVVVLFFANFFSSQVTVSGKIKDKDIPLPYVSVLVKFSADSVFVVGGITKEDGSFSLSGIKPGDYFVDFVYTGYKPLRLPLLAGNLNLFLDMGAVIMEKDSAVLAEVEISAKQDEVVSVMDKRTFNISENTTQSGGSVLQAMRNLPGVSVDQNNKVLIRGSDKVTILIDGKQTALAGFDNQSGLDNIPASAVERIEIINNPSSKYDANGNAGIINIIFKKSKQDGFSGKAGLALGLGALWERKENLPLIKPQFRNTPKVNPSLFLLYRKSKVSVFFQGDYLFTRTLNKNEFTERDYDTLKINQQMKRNRNTTFATVKTGVDWNFNESNTFSLSGLFGTEKILDNGDEPFFNADYTQLNRLWQFLEDELKTTVTASASWQHKFGQAGHLLNVSCNYSFHREDEKYFFTNTMPSFVGNDAFKLLSDEHVSDITFDYIRPMKKGRWESGFKFRRRFTPTNMQFFPGINSPLDTNAGGWANYTETIPALYGTWIYETKNIELEAGLRAEYVEISYDVNPQHSTYKSDGYNYMQPFPNLRMAYKFKKAGKISVFYNRRVDRPGEVDIRIFPKYDDAEILKIGNPALNPQFTNSFELGYKLPLKKGYFYSALYHRIADATITRIATTLPANTLIYSIMQNAGRSYNSGIELIYTFDSKGWFSFNASINGYQNSIEAFSVENKYPEVHYFYAESVQQYSGNCKLNLSFKLPWKWELQLSAVYLAPDIIPQGKIGQRYSLDMGLKRKVLKKGEFFLNGTDVLNSLVVRKEVFSSGLRLTSTDYSETQVVRAGFNYKF